ncbi:MAG: hypothetical protein IPJ65_08190 [Archangiaceae bacterium]|nr:hypothetical protein [Archangiaceae bacterium]
MTALMLAAMLMAAEAPKVPKAQHLELGPDDISGQRQGPEGSYTVGHKPTVFPNLIKVRENFSDKIVRSVDQM